MVSQYRNPAPFVNLSLDRMVGKNNIGDHPRRRREAMQTPPRCSVTFTRIEQHHMTVSLNLLDRRVRGSCTKGRKRHDSHVLFLPLTEGGLTVEKLAQRSEVERNEECLPDA